MTEKVLQEEQANPYNQNKTWHEIEEKPFKSSEQLYFEEPSEKNKLFATNDLTEATPESVITENLESNKKELYKKPDYKKRYDDLKRHHDKTVNSLRAKQQELLDEATKNRTEYKAPKTVEELEDFRNEYPEVYEVVETVAHLQSESKSKVLEERLSKLQDREVQIQQKEAIKRLNAKHPDFQEIKNSDDFHSWAATQPQSIQDWVYNNPDDADLAVRALDLFKSDIGLNVTTPVDSMSSSKRTNSAADMVSTKTTNVEPTQEKIWSEKEITAMSIAEFDKHESEISDAMQEGRIRK